MRRELARWQSSGLKLREYGQQHGIPVSTLSWWRQVFRRAGEQGNAASKQSGRAMWWCSPRCRSRRTFQGHASVVEIVLHSGHLVRVPAGADTETLQRVLQALQTTC